MRVHGIAGASLLLVSCGKSVTVSTPAPRASATNDASATTVSARPPTADAAPPADEPCDPIRWVKDACWREHLLGKTIDTSSAAWLTEHGAKKVDEPFADLGICYEARVGPSFEEAVICTHRFGTNAGVELGSTKIVTVRNHRPLLLLEALDYMSEMSVAPSGPDEPTGPLFALTADVSNLGKEVRFSLPKPTACTEATAHVEQEDPSAAGASPEARKLLAKNRKEAQKYLRLICANATTFTWSNGVYKK